MRGFTRETNLGFSDSLSGSLTRLAAHVSYLLAGWLVASYGVLSVLSVSYTRTTYVWEHGVLLGSYSVRVLLVQLATWVGVRGFMFHCTGPAEHLEPPPCEGLCSYGRQVSPFPFSSLSCTAGRSS